MAKLDSGEFDFSQAPALGGPSSSSLSLKESHSPSLINMLDALANQIENRQQQLDTLEALLADRKLQNDVFLAGRPIRSCKGRFRNYRRSLWCCYLGR